MNFTQCILTKILVPVISITIILVTIVALVGFYTFSQFAQETFDKEVRTISLHIERDIRTMRSIASDQVNGLAADAGIIIAITDGNREKIRNIITDFESARKCTFFTILDADGRVIFRTNRPEQFGDSQASLQSVNAALAGRRGVYFESTPNSPFAIRAAAPVLDENGTLIGVVTGGFRLDTDEWVDGIQQYYDVECTVFAGDRRVATTTRRAGTSERIVGTTLNDPEIQDQVIRNQTAIFQESTVEGRPMKVSYSPLFNERDTQAMGMFFVGIPMERQTLLVRQKIGSIFLVSTIGLLAFVGILFGIAQAIVMPIRKMTKAAKDLADGIIDVDLDVRSKDETAVLAEAFRDLAKSLQDKTNVALAIADGDMTVWVPLRSEHDTLGISLIRMRYSLYDSINRLTELAKTVHEEIKRLVTSNQCLVSNTERSTGQLKSIVDTINSLNTQTQQNAEQARQAEDLTKLARDGSNDGTEKMGRMVVSMGGITKSAGEIKNIIRVIDDIAFQTNLLALNAAVEAARAGQHGKGFAVVAEEVRNLASRSAKAASETAELIEESIRQVGQGGTVAQETSSSLKNIVDQVEQINQIVSVISTESDRQTQHLGDITNTVNQVSELADSNLRSVSEVSEVVDLIDKTIYKLDVIIEYFKSHPDGNVMQPGVRYEGYIPPRGTFAHRQFE
ncbi:MAG: methyl-accepting chemotaxis protein [Planctomycetaceae bacterium]|nr:methyl-accepting chemotaxis protein [Planctomycetaceae bacterium]